VGSNPSLLITEKVAHRHPVFHFVAACQFLFPFQHLKHLITFLPDILRYTQFTGRTADAREPDNNADAINGRWPKEQAASGTKSTEFTQ
jgi:hypothetical protein